MSIRPPLGLSRAENVHVNHSEGKLEADTVKASMKTESGGGGGSRLEREILSLKARVSRRDETIVKLQNQVKSHASRGDLESQLQEIVKRHEASKVKYQADLSKLKATNETLQKANEEIKAKEGQVSAKVSDIRSKLALAEAENGRLKKELAGRPIPLAGPSVDDRLTWRKERAALEQEIKALKKDGEVKARKVEEAGKEAELFRSLRGENERLRYGWAVMAGEYGDLYESFQANERDLSRTTRSFDSERHILEIRVDSLEHLLSDTMEERDEARQHLALISAQRDLLSDMTEELLSSRPERHEEIARPLHEEILPLGPLIDSSDAAQLLDLSIGHNALIGEHLSDLEPHILSLTASIMTLEENLRSTTSTLASLQATHGRLEAEHAQNRLEHASCGVTISQLRYDADSASQMTAVREEELAEARIDLRKSEERIQKHADLLAQATENEARSKFALESLEEEIVHLQNKYHEFVGYEEKYEELLERQAILEARETVAIEEAERLSMQNAELLGHTNGSQRIGYVDNVRREMVLCKHELASTRHLLNNANDRIRALESEVLAYTSISPDLGLGQSRTRVVRRQPEGSHLTASLSASSAKRISVSGPGGARRFI